MKKKFIVGLIFLMSLSFTGCKNQVFKTEAESQVLAAMDQVKKGDLDKIVALFKLEPEKAEEIKSRYDGLNKKLIKTYFEEIDYVVKEDSSDGNKAKVNLFIKYRDPKGLTDLLDKHSQSLLSDKDLLKKVKKIRANKEKEIELELIKEGSRWVLDDNLILSFISQIN